MNRIIHGDCLEKLKELQDGSVDCIVTDPPYGYSFMGKAWDKAVVGVETWRECLRVLKPGAFAFVMSAPRQDVLSRMMVNLANAGFKTDFTSIYWTYASGFPKAMNIGKMVDKRGGVSVSWFGEWLKDWRKKNDIAQKEVAALFPSKTGRLTGCVANWELGLNIPTPQQFSTICRHFNLPFESIEAAEREIVGKQSYTVPTEVYQVGEEKVGARAESLITLAKTDAAKALDGSYGGFQPKPAVEVILVAMKPLSERTYVDQALKNGKGVTWLDEVRVPSDSIPVRGERKAGSEYGQASGWNDHKNKDTIGIPHKGGRFPANLVVSDDALNDGKLNNVDFDSYSRFFSLDAWAEKTLPFLIVPKASKREKGKDTKHPTIKPVKLMSYLITLSSREGDTVLDPFLGSGTTAIAAKMLERNYIGIEREEEYVKIAEARICSTEPALP